jgi:tetratricopeptide (TPR) repeat protein
VRRVGSDIRVTAQIVDSRDGRVHWTQGFERPLAELAVLQEELVVEVASHLNVRLQQIEIERALRKPDSLTAWEYLVRALSLSVSQNQDGIREALEYSRKAVALAPEFGAAHAQLATTAAVNYWQVSGGDDEALRREARDAAHRALELEHDSPPLLTWVAQALCMVGAWNEGLRCAERAVAINPNLEASHAAMIMVSIHFKRAEEALKHIEACERLAPRAPDTHVRLIQRSGAYFLLGRFAEALDAAEQALIFQPAFNIAKKDRAIFLEKLGRREEAIEALCEFRESWPGVTLDQVRLLHQRSLLAPDLATELYETFATVWQAAETPSEVE